MREWQTNSFHEVFCVKLLLLAVPKQSKSSHKHRLRQINNLNIITSQYHSDNTLSGTWISKRLCLDSYQLTKLIFLYIWQSRQMIFIEHFTALKDRDLWELMTWIASIFSVMNSYYVQINGDKLEISRNACGLSERKLGSCLKKQQQQL